MFSTFWSLLNLTKVEFLRQVARRRCRALIRDSLRAKPRRLEPATRRLAHRGRRLNVRGHLKAAPPAAGAHPRIDIFHREIPALRAGAAHVATFVIRARYTYFTRFFGNAFNCTFFTGKGSPAASLINLRSAKFGFP